MVQPRNIRKKTQMFDKNIDLRGNVPTKTHKSEGLMVGPVVIGFLLFVVVGSAVLTFLRQG